jgi:hypothetical protein
MKCKQFLLALLAVLGMVGCKEKEPETYYVSQEMLMYCWFPNGSYWVYQEAGSGGWDSVYASEATHRMNVDNDELGYDYEGYGLTLTVQGKKRRQATIAWPTGSQGAHTLSETTEIYADSSGQQVDYVFFWDSRGRDTLASYPTTYIDRHWDSIVIHGTTYYDAIEVVTDLPAADWTFNLVWAKDIGIVRRFMVDGTIWELVRYHINR